MLTNNCIDNSTNRVYINPNFNRSSSKNISAAMHINPRFSHLQSNLQPSLQNKSKIYVNPNFVKSASSTSFEFLSPSSYIVDNNPSSVYHHEQPIIEKDAINVAAPTSRSRYTLVRHTTTKLLNEKKEEQTKKTYQVNKYKSIPLKDIKRNLEDLKKTENQLSSSLSSCTQANNAVSTNKKFSVPSTSSTIASQFKLVNHENIGSVVRQDRFKLKSLTNLKKVQLNHTRLKRSKGNLKKNNIPCPMFRKFGKCLRKMRGNCEFLHDKKHVSICRKFIIGLCHDKNCLLSHDLTTKKMPTCYFYLQGTCTKTDCPYLHVKLNEKVKICADFLKGYCEKGSKCLQRHIQAEKAPKHSLVKRPSMPPKKKNSRVKDKTWDPNQEKICQSIQNSANIEKNENTPDCRYYHEQRDASTSDCCEIIKPMRCKLGILPSFIQL